MSRTMRSASAFEGASIMDTNARSPSGTPPASIFPQPNHVFEMGITVCSSDCEKWLSIPYHSGSGARASWFGNRLTGLGFRGTLIRNFDGYIGGGRQWQRYP